VAAAASRWNASAKVAKKAETEKRLPENRSRFLWQGCGACQNRKNVMKSRHASRFHP
jgi:ribosomal protein S27E